MKHIIRCSLVFVFVFAFFSFGTSAFASEVDQPVQTASVVPAASSQSVAPAEATDSSQSGTTSAPATIQNGSVAGTLPASSPSNDATVTNQPAKTGQQANAVSSQQNSQNAGSAESTPQTTAGSTPAASVSPAVDESAANGSPIIQTQVLSEDAVYTLRNASDADKVVDVSGGSTAAGANVQLWQDDSTFAQVFRVLWLQNGWYNFINLKSGKYLDVAGAGVSDGTNVWQYDGNGTDAQKWGLVLIGGFYQLVPYIAQDKRLDVSGGSTANGANVQIWDDNSTNAQLFDIRRNDAISTAYADSKKQGFAPVGSDSIYEIVSSLSPDGTMVLDIPCASDAAGTKVQSYTKNETVAQKFQFDYLGNGLYKIVSICSGNVLDVTSGDMSNGARIQQYFDNGTFAQAWYLEAAGNYYIIHSAKSGKVIDVLDAQAVDGGIIQQYEADGTLAQEFLLRKTQLVADGVYVIQTSYLAPMVIDIAGASTADGANAQIWRSNGTDAQKFRFTYDAADNAYGIYSIASGKYLDVACAGTSVGTNVWQYSSNGSKAQLWKIGYSNGEYTFTSLCNGLFLDVSGASYLPGANVQVWTGNGSDAQRFNLEDGNWSFYAGASSDAMNLIQYAEQYEGEPYVWGGRSPDQGFDCAGLVEWCANQVFGMGIDTAYTNAESLFNNFCDQISAATAQAGDIVFFRGTYGDDVNYISHVLIYCGHGVAYGAGDPIAYTMTNTITNIYDQVADIIYARLRH